MVVGGRAIDNLLAFVELGQNQEVFRWASGAVTWRLGRVEKFGVRFRQRVRTVWVG